MTQLPNQLPPEAKSLMSACFTLAHSIAEIKSVADDDERGDQTAILEEVEKLRARFDILWSLCGDALIARLWTAVETEN